MGNINIQYKIKLKRDILIKDVDDTINPYLKTGEIVNISKSEYSDLIGGLSVDRVMGYNKLTYNKLTYSICDADVDYYMKDTITIETEILD